jgi:predicted metalloprotease
MKWQGRRESSNVEDMRGQTGGGGGGGVGLPLGRLLMGGGGGLGMIVVVIVVLLLVNFFNQPGGGPEPGGPPPDDEDSRFVKVVLADTEDVWHKLLGDRYVEPKLRIFNEEIQSGCGLADAGMGPFYCPNDQKIYIDLRFFQELSNRFKAPGRFAQAYVIAHEVGHHVQNLTGDLEKVHKRQQVLTAQGNKTEANHESVRLELQADFLAGVWAHHAEKMKHILEPGDLEAALKAAKAIGDDRLQKDAKGWVNPDSFTHGTSEQRIKWFKLGFETGDLKKADLLFSLPYDQL